VTFVTTPEADLLDIYIFNLNNSSINGTDDAKHRPAGNGHAGGNPQQFYKGHR
jgi:hypothetical protein